MFQPVGGMDRLPHALAEAIEGKIRYERGGPLDHDVERAACKVVFRDSSGQSHEAEADYCVCSIPPTVLRSIPSNFGPDAKLALRSLQPVPVGKLGLEYRRRFWEEDDRIFGGDHEHEHGHRRDLVPVVRLPRPQSGVLIGYYNFFDQASRYGALRAGRARAARARGRAEDPRRRVRAGSSARRSRSSGRGRATRSAAGRSGRRATRAPTRRSAGSLQAQGNLWFCGDHLSDRRRVAARRDRVGARGRDRAAPQGDDREEEGVRRPRRLPRRCDQRRRAAPARSSVTVAG